MLQGVEEYKETTLIIYSVGEGAVKAIMEDDLGFIGTIEAIGTSYRDVFTIIELTQDELLRNNIDGALGIDAATLEGSVNEVSMIVQTGDGADDISYVYLYQGNGTENDMMNYAAAYDENTNSTYLNTLGTDISLGGDIITSLFIEAQRKYNHDTGITLTDAQQQNLAYFRGDQAGTLWNRFSDTASTESNRTGVYNWNVNNAGSSTLVYGTDRAANLVTGAGSGVVPAHFGKRPLSGAPWLGPASDNPGSLDDKHNTEISHEHLFFDDGTGDNVGFGPDGRFSEDNPKNMGYRHQEIYYDDDLMRKALDNVEDGEYSLLGRNKNNCQDWADRVREEYERIYNQLSDQEKTKIDLNVKKLEIKNKLNKELKGK